MIYRAWTFKDILEITRLEGECFSEEKWTYEMFAASFSQKGFIGELCETFDPFGNKELAGYACVQSVLDEGDFLNIAVAEQYRRQGIGKTLLLRILNVAKRRGVKKIFLEVRKLNEAAKKLYFQSGFSIIGERKKYYPDGENAIVMQKEL